MTELTLADQAAYETFMQPFTNPTPRRSLALSMLAMMVGMAGVGLPSPTPKVPKDTEDYERLEKARLKQERKAERRAWFAAAYGDPKFFYR